MDASSAPEIVQPALIDMQSVTRRITNRKPQEIGSIMVLMAHPDDAELWAGGTIAIHSRVSRVTIVVNSNDKVRRAEAMSGARILGAGLVLRKDLSVETCIRLLQEMQPDIVITHRLDDVHPEHREVAKITLAAIPETVIRTGHPVRLYSCDTYNSLTISGSVPGHTIVNVTKSFEIKLQALSAHASQPLGYFIPMAKQLGALWGARIGSCWAEAFDPIPVLGRLPGSDYL